MTRTPPPVLGEFEQIVMLALVRLGPEAYGATVSAEMACAPGGIPYRFTRFFGSL